MKTLNKTASKIVFDIVARLEGSDYMKFDNNPEGSGFMPLSVEKKAFGIILPTHKDVPGDIYSLAHYYEQNGDLMSDPYMEFLLIDLSPLRAKYAEKVDEKELKTVQWQQVYPITFEQSGMFATYQESAIVEDGRITKYVKRWQNEHASFANGWMKNIVWQQGFDKNPFTPTAAAKNMSIAERLITVRQNLPVAIILDGETYYYKNVDDFIYYDSECKRRCLDCTLSYPAIVELRLLRESSLQCNK